MSQILSLQLSGALLGLLTLLTLGLVVMEWICIFLSVCRSSRGSHWSRYGFLTSAALVVASMLPACSDICFVFEIFWLMIHTVFPPVLLCPILFKCRCSFSQLSCVMRPYNSGPELAWVDFYWCLLKPLLHPARWFVELPTGGSLSA